MRDRGGVVVADHRQRAARTIGAALRQRGGAGGDGRGPARVACPAQAGGGGVRATARAALGSAGARPRHRAMVRRALARAAAGNPAPRVSRARLRARAAGHAGAVLARPNDRADDAPTRAPVDRPPAGSYVAPRGSVAQSVEHATFNRQVPGSNPGGPTTRREQLSATRYCGHRDRSIRRCIAGISCAAPDATASDLLFESRFGGRCLWHLDGRKPA